MIDTVVTQPKSKLRNIDAPEPPRLREQIDQQVNSGGMQYAIGEIIGQGTFGKVYKVLNRQDGRYYALKTVLQQKKYKNRELSIVSSVEHFNVVRLLDSFYTLVSKPNSVETYLNLVTNLMPSSLFVQLRSKKKQPSALQPLTIKLYAFQLFKALAYFQDIGLAHRDIKPMNILVDPETNELQICDFGSAKVLQPNEANICYMCSRYYRAPQLLFGLSDYATEIDVWSMGCVLVEMVTREPIFAGENTLDQIIEIVKVVGTPSEGYLAQSPDFRDLKLPQLKGHSWKSLLRKYQCTPEFLDLLQKVLTLDRKTRITPAEALLHDYFKDLVSEENRSAIAKIPELFDFSKNEFKHFPATKSELEERFGGKHLLVREMHALVLADQKPNPESIGEESTSRGT